MTGMTAETAPTYSIVTTCKGRLDDLKRSLPRFMAQQDAEVIVVDYDCPQHCGEWAEREFPDVKVARVTDRPQFNLPDARNCGAKIAGGSVLVFLDADIMVDENFLANTIFPTSEKRYGTFGMKKGNSLRGSCMVRRADFEALGGYDELLSGYMGEDLDFYRRLKILGARRSPLDPDAVEEVVEQTAEEREKFRSPNIRKQFLCGQLYQMAKEAVMRMEGMARVELGMRQSLMAEVERQIDAVFSGEGNFEIRLEFPDRYKRDLLKNWEFSTEIRVRAKRRPNT